MKNPSVTRRNGFTLIELLVVIAIIAVLAGAGFAAGNAAIQKAKRTTALATATALESAVNNFYTEYGSMPKEMTADETILTTSAQGVTLLNVLLGLETIPSPINTRAVRFLSVREGKANRNGIIYNAAGTTVSGLYDPWGGPFSVALDGNYDEIVSASPSGASVNLNGRRAAAWSNGADYNGENRPSDDVKTW